MRGTIRQIVHSRAQAINKSLVDDPIVGETLALCIVESARFQKFVQIMDPMYRPSCRNTILVTFSDGSQDTYGTCAYARW